MLVRNRRCARDVHLRYQNSVDPPQLFRTSLTQSSLERRVLFLTPINIPAPSDEAGRPAFRWFGHYLKVSTKVGGVSGPGLAARPAGGAWQGSPRAAVSWETGTWGYTYVTSSLTVCSQEWKSWVRAYGHFCVNSQHYHVAFGVGH